MHPKIAGMMQKYNKKFSELRISNVCKLEGVKIYRLPNVKGFDIEKGQLRTCNMFNLKKCSNKLCKMALFLKMETEKAYP